MSRATHTFDSRAQERWAFATHKSWARRWAENTEVSGKPLPKRKRAKSARSLLTGHAGR